MYLLEIAMCEKCRRAAISSRRGSKKFEDWGGGGGGGVKHFKTRGVTDLWGRGGTFAGGWVSTLLRVMVNVTV